jgi:hypothetical protein
MDTSNHLPKLNIENYENTFPNVNSLQSGSTKKHMIPLNRKKQINGVVEVIDISDKYISHINHIKNLHNISAEILDNIEDLEINKIKKIITYYEKIIEIIRA